MTLELDSILDPLCASKLKSTSLSYDFGCCNASWPQALEASKHIVLVSNMVTRPRMTRVVMGMAMALISSWINSW